MAGISHWQALGRIHVAALLFGLTGVFGELIQATAIAITLGRAAFAVCALAGFAIWQRQGLLAGLRGPRVAAIAMAGALLATHWITFFISVKTGGIAIATLGFASFPAFITLLEGILFRERIQAAEWGMLLLVSAGLVLITPSFDLADQGTVGIAWGIASGFSFALLALANRHSARGLNPLQVACWQNLAVVLLTLPFAWNEFATIGAMSWLWLALLGVFCTGLSHYLFVSSLTRLNARTAGLVIALEPVYAIAFAWVLFGQEPGVRTMLGALLILAASVYSSMRQKTSGQS
jgi:drug/metabolite transporter (DMT)-like permease